MLKIMSIFEEIAKDTNDVSFLQLYILRIVKEYNKSNTRIIFNEYICLNDKSIFITKFNRHDENQNINILAVAYLIAGRGVLVFRTYL